MTIFPSRKTPEREQWYAICDRTGQVFGPFDPGTVWFETPPHVRGGDLLQLQRVTDLILNEAYAGWERLQKALAFMQPNGVSVYRRFMETGILPKQTPALVGLAGGLDIPGYLGDGAETSTRGLHVDDSHDGLVIAGQTTNTGLGRGGHGHPSTRNTGGGGGGGYGATGSEGAHGTVGGRGGAGGSVVSAELIWEGLRRNALSAAILEHGAGGGTGGHKYRSVQGDLDASGRPGGTGGSASINIAPAATLTTIARTLTGSDGTSTSNDGGSGGGGAGGLWLGIAASIAYGAGTIDVSGGAGGAAARAGGDGGDGRVVQVYYDSKATLTVSGAVENQYRILRSVPLGQVVIL